MISNPLNARYSAVLMVAACCTAASAADAPTAAGIDLAGMDRSVAPGDDFFRYANGTWLKTTEIPADRGTYGVGWIVTDRTSERTVELIQQAAGSGAAASPVAKKVGDYYATFMDLPAIEARGLRPLQPALDRIAAIKDVRDLSRVLGGNLRTDVDALNATNFYTDNLFGLWIAQDFNDKTRYVPFLLQGGLDMPDREYYVDPQPRMAEIRAKHQNHVAALLELAGLREPEARAARIVDLERRIAEAHWKREESESVGKANNPWTRKQFDTLAPGIDWTAFFAEAALSGQNDFIVWQPSAITGLSALVASQPLQTWKDYLTFHAIEHSAAVLPEAFGTESFNFHGTVLGGTPKRRDRWKRGVAATDGALGEAVGRIYVMNAMNFPAGILQPPYFDLSRPVAMDYGAIGAIIGHEITHSFDDQGAQFDNEGRLRNWWTDQDLAHFRRSSEKLVQQYDAYRPLPDLAVNGKLTLSENIADVAGLAAAYDAYKMSLGGKPAPVVAGLTGDQQFFIAYAQSWRGKAREPSLRLQVLGDSHAPGEYRVATVRNLDAWYAAFDVKPGQAMYLPPAERIRVW